MNLSFLSTIGSSNRNAGKLRVMRVASYFELRVVHLSLTSLSCSPIILSPRLDAVWFTPQYKFGISLGGIFHAGRHFSLKISALDFDLISTSIFSKAKIIRKRRNKISAVEREEAPGTHCIAKKMYSKAKEKLQEKILVQTDFFKNRMKKDNYSLIQSLW